MSDSMGKRGIAFQGISKGFEIVSNHGNEELVRKYLEGLSPELHEHILDIYETQEVPKPLRPCVEDWLSSKGLLKAPRAGMTQAHVKYLNAPELGSIDTW